MTIKLDPNWFKNGFTTVVFLVAALALLALLIGLLWVWAMVFRFVMVIPMPLPFKLIGGAVVILVPLGWILGALD